MEKKNKELTKGALEIMQHAIQPTDVEDSDLRSKLDELTIKEIEKETKMQELADEFNAQDEAAREEVQAMFYDIEAQEEARCDELVCICDELTRKDNEVMDELNMPSVEFEGGVM